MIQGGCRPALCSHERDVEGRPLLDGVLGLDMAGHFIAAGFLTRRIDLPALLHDLPRHARARRAAQQSGHWRWRRWQGHTSLMSAFVRSVRAATMRSSKVGVMPGATCERNGGEPSKARQCGPGSMQSASPAAATCRTAQTCPRCPTPPAPSGLPAPAWSSAPAGASPACGSIRPAA